MISDTDFVICPPAFVEKACGWWLPPGIASDSEIAEIKAQCEGDRALCLACEDGMVVVELRPHQDSLELFVWIAIAFRRGAFERQHAALQQIARDLGARTIAFQSRRKGWARRLGPNWSPRGENEFVRQVDE